MSEFPIERLVWIDSMGLENGEWIRVRDLPPELEPANLRVESVGYIVAETKEAVALAHSRSLWDETVATERVSNVMVVPRGAILKREPLVVRRKRK